MVSGHLQVKKGLYYIVLNYVNKDGKRCRPSIPTGLPEKGNKRRAEQMLLDARGGFEIPKETELGGDILFSEYLLEWLEIVKVRIKPATFASYSGMVKNTIAPYFQKKQVTLRGLEPRHLQSFYTEKLRTVKPNTVIHYHAVIHQALKYAVKTEMISSNPADKIDRPKKNDFEPGFYDANEMAALFEAVKGHKLELPVLVGAFYGLRRGELLGLRWSAIDFERGTITVKHTVTSFNLDGKHVQIAQDSAKTKSSMRTLPLVGQFRDYFLKVKATQEENKRVCGNAYSKKYNDYVFVDELGILMKPSYITAEFPKLLERQGLRRIRYHDLRHSCASLLLANGVPMKQIQEWLGHSDFSTTANVYAHLDYSSKISSAQAMEKGIALPESPGFESKWNAMSGNI
ncbi:site-specific integrase [Ruminococcaceae bacterium OttesenSCG-928-L11]|nr:site-specific integrase [Ruminococcaceae bacterium OttesenSCG-928-L11]